MKPIVLIPNDVLTSPAKTVTTFDKKLAALIADMKVTLAETRNPKGVGLAATQVGVPWRVFVIKPTEKSVIRAFINPEVIESKDGDTVGSAKPDTRLEGCLSIPAIWGKVNRDKSVRLAYQDESGGRHEEVFTDFPAVIIQHETDHLNGILFTQRVLEQNNKLYQSGKDKQGKEVLDEIKI